MSFIPNILPLLDNRLLTKWSESCSVVSDSSQPHGLYSPWNSPGQNTGVGSLSFLQGIFPSQGSNPGLPHCRQILYQLSHKGSPRILEWVLLHEIFPTQQLNRDLLHCRWITKEETNQYSVELLWNGRVMEGFFVNGLKKKKKWPLNSNCKSQFWIILLCFKIFLSMGNPFYF